MTQKQTLLAHSLALDFPTWRGRGVQRRTADSHRCGRPALFL